MNRLGTVRELWRFPVKSMAGERVAESAVRWAGLAGDRRYAFVRAGNDSRFPWLTAKVHAGLLQYAARCVDPQDPNLSAIRVTTPAGHELSIDDPALGEELASGHASPVQLLQSGRGLHDAAQLSLISQATVASLCGAHGLPPDVRRFRMNLVVDGVDPFEEERWLGRELRIGEGDDAVRIRLDRRVERCVMITLDPASIEGSKALLTRLAAEREACAGVYASVVGLGRIREGDAIYFG